MKLKTSNDTYDIADVNYVNGKLNIDFTDKTCEELQAIFSDKGSIATLKVYTDTDDLTSVIPGYAVLEQITLVDDIKTVILAKETDDTEARITALSVSAEATAETAEENTTNIESLKADVDYIAMSMEVTLDE